MKNTENDSFDISGNNGSLSRTKMTVLSKTTHDTTSDTTRDTTKTVKTSETLE